MQDGVVLLTRPSVKRNCHESRKQMKLDCESLCHGYPDCVAFSYVPERFWCSMYIGGPYVSAVYSERFPGTICTVMDLSRRLDLSQNTIRATNKTSPAPYFVV
eukprot:GEMP01045779.1.p2 GENE.GEMP01045779.1~~GEMP01045779.1.p2  ORF type:complete len:103 (+),score=10.83 GEMP01045779.1:369-677(+)